MHTIIMIPLGKLQIPIVPNFSINFPPTHPTSYDVGTCSFACPNYTLITDSLTVRSYGRCFGIHSFGISIHLSTGKCSPYTVLMTSENATVNSGVFCDGDNAVNVGQLTQNHLTVDNLLRIKLMKFKVLVPVGRWQKMLSWCVRCSAISEITSRREVAMRLCSQCVG